MTSKRFEIDMKIVSCFRRIFLELRKDWITVEAGGKVRGCEGYKVQRDQGMERRENEDSRNEEGKYPACSSCTIQLQGGLLKLE